MSSNTDDETPKPINEQPPVDEKREEKAKAKEETKEEKKDNNEKKKTEDAATALERPSTLGSEETEENSASSDEEEKGDAGEVEDDDAPLEEAEDFKIPLKLTKSGRKRATPFPLKLMKVLSNKEFTDIIAWTASGKAFNIIQPKLFTSNILPGHFKQAKYSSFTRKLHRWGFMRHYRGTEAGAFFHKHFRRGRLDLVEKMTCSKPGASPNAGGARARAAAEDSAPAMNVTMDTSSSSRSSGNHMLNNSTLMASGITAHPFSLPQFSAGAGGFSSGFIQRGIPQQLLMQQFGGQQFGGISSTQQQMFAQQQMQQAQQQHAMQAKNSPGDADLDAAIEMEVARRLKERFNAASFSRQALSMMQGGQTQGAQVPNQFQHIQGHMDHSSMMHQMMGTRFGGVSAAGMGGGAPIQMQGFSQNFKGFDNQGGGIVYNVNVQDPYAMPSNIQGAKTA